MFSVAGLIVYQHRELHLWVIQTYVKYWLITSNIQQQLQIKYRGKKNMSYLEAKTDWITFWRVSLEEKQIVISKYIV